MEHIGFYSGSFDPVTNGHMDIIARAAKLVDRLIIGIGVHHGKTPLFTEAERVAMLEQEIAALPDLGDVQIAVSTFDNLTVDAARAAGATVIVRGLRDSKDFDYEMQMSGMNGAMAPDLETVFLAASPEVRHIAGVFVRQIAAMGGDVTSFVPAAVAARLSEKLRA
ncbi:MAG: pantetheine-phosphate adenylyltransferase [Hyphomicrobiales bacterium]|nr:pantetheine-phosphate adenylyltransferase [Hyphomicrobiales bacterium]